MRWQVHAEVLEVAVVDADHVGVDARARPRAPRRATPPRSRRGRGRRRARRASRELLRAQRAHHEQHGVGAGGLGLVELVGVDREVLAQDRQLGGRARLAQVGERAAEVRLLGEHRHGRRAAALVGAHDLGAAGALADRARPTASGACARRSATCRGATAPRRTGAPRARCPPRARARTAALALAPLDRVARGLHEVVEPRAHALAPLHVALEHRRARRPSRSPPRRAGAPVVERVGPARRRRSRRRRS